MDIKDVIIGVVLAVLAFLKPIDGELWSLVVVFGLNFLFGSTDNILVDAEGVSVTATGTGSIIFVIE